MASSIDATKPTATNAYTADVRGNFANAKSEIETLQTATGSASTVAGLRAAVEAAVPAVLSYDTSQTLTKATHQGKLIVITGSSAVSLTVDNSTDFDPQGACEVVNEGTNVVTFVATATISRIGSKPLTLPAKGRATLMRMTSADTYLLTGEMA